MRISCIIRWGLKTYFKHFDQICYNFFDLPRASGDVWGSAERAVYASLHNHSNLAARGLSHGMEFTHKHTNTHTKGACVHASHTDTHHPAIHLPYTQRSGKINAHTWWNICIASRRVCWMMRLKKSSRNHKSDLRPSHHGHHYSLCLLSGDQPLHGNQRIEMSLKNTFTPSATFNQFFSWLNKIIDSCLVCIFSEKKLDMWLLWICVSKLQGTRDLPSCLLPLWRATIVFASILHTHSIAARGSVRNKFVKRDPGVKLEQSTVVCIPLNQRETTSAYKCIHYFF